MSETHADPAAAPTGDLVQIPKDQYELMVRSTRLLQSAWNHTEHGEAARRLLNKVDPTIPIPEQIGDRIADSRLKPLEDRIGSIDEQIKKLAEDYESGKKEREDNSARDDLLKRLDAVKDKFRFSDEGMELVRKRMLDQKSADVEGAAAFIAAENAQPPEPADAGLFPRKANLFGVTGGGDDDIAALHKDPLAWQDNMLSEMLRENPLTAG